MGEGTVDPTEVDFHRTGLVSVFIRHRLDLVPLAGSTERNVVQIHDPALKPKSRPSDRRQVRRNLEAGYAVELIPGTETSAVQRAAFLDLYEQTMRRTDAAAHYFFGAAYFDEIFGAERTWLALATDPDGAPAAASIACVSRRLPPLLPQRQRRRAARRLADEERPRPPDRARQRARSCR